MSLDFLRRLAFEGELQNFFKEDQFAFSEVSTGVSLRFNREFLRHVYREDRGEGAHNFFSSKGNGFRSQVFDELSAGDDWDEVNHYTWWSTKSKPERPIEIVVDLPDMTSVMDREYPKAYEGYPIVYRQRDVALAHCGAGQKLQSSQSGKTGTLCTIIDDGDDCFGITCGHVADGQGDRIRWQSAGDIKDGEVTASVVPSEGTPCNRAAVPCDCGVDAALMRRCSKLQSAMRLWGRVISPSKLR